MDQFEVDPEQIVTGAGETASADVKPAQDPVQKPSWRIEGSSGSRPHKLEFRYKPKDAARYIKLTKVLLPPPMDIETAAIHFGGGIAIDKLASTVEKKLVARELKKQAMPAAVPSGAGHISLSPHELHVTGPEPAILPKLPVLKPPVVFRPSGK